MTYYSYNNISELRSETFNSLIKLIELDVDHNSISYVDPKILNKLTNLKYLYMNNNKISNLFFTQDPFDNKKIKRILLSNLFSQHPLTQDTQLISMEYNHSCAHYFTAWQYNNIGGEENYTLNKLDISHNLLTILNSTIIKYSDSIRILNNPFMNKTKLTEQLSHSTQICIPTLKEITARYILCKQNNWKPIDKIHSYIYKWFNHWIKKKETLKRI